MEEEHNFQQLQPFFFEADLPDSHVQVHILSA